MLVHPADWLAAPLETAGLFVGVLLVKALLAGGAALLFGAGTRVSVLVGLGLAQVGEFAFILAKFGAGYGLLPDESYQTFLSISVLTMLCTPFAFLLSPSLAGVMQARVSFLEGYLPRVSKFSAPSTAPAKEREKGHTSKEGHVIVIGYGLNGKNVSRVLREAKIDYVISELNPLTVSKMRAQGEPIFYGDATRAEVLHHLGIERARVLVVVIADPSSSRQIVAVARSRNPKVTIIVRTRYVSEIDGLYRLGADEVVPEEFETSLEILGRVLRGYGIAEMSIQQQQEEIRRERYGLLLGRRPPASALALPALLGGQALSSVTIEAGFAAEGATLATLDLRKKGGASVLAIHRSGREEVQADPALVLAAGDVLVLLGEAEQVRHTEEMLRAPHSLRRENKPGEGPPTKN
jgi:CPA2 family monovalent cation:H+ antiporter-2